MTTTEKRLSIAATALALLVAVLFAMGGIFGTSAHALAPEYNEDPYYYDIYYFTDYYQVIEPARLEEEFDGRHVFVDRQKDLDETKFADMIQNGYFYGLNSDSVVIIDIKTFKPDPYVLYDLFYNLKSEQNCRTIFVSIYEYNQTEEDGTQYDPWFMEHVDKFIDDSNYDRLNSFIYNSFRDIYNARDTVDNTAYIIDGYLVDVGTECDLGDDGVPDDYIQNNFGADMDTLCADSPFLGILVKQLICWLETPYIYDPNYYNSYEEIAQKLRDDYDIRLLIHMGGNKFVDILTWEVCERNNACDFIGESSDAQKSIDKVYVFGFWQLTQDFYDYLELSATIGEPLPTIYILIVDYPYNDDGILPMITDSSLANIYGREWDESAIELINGIQQIIN